jgi:hypothetical protein
MILTALPSPGVQLEAQKLRTSAWKAICSVELAAQSGAGGKTNRADTLRDFFLECARACDLVAVTPITTANI